MKDWIHLPVLDAGGNATSLRTFALLVPGGMLIRHAWLDSSATGNDCTTDRPASAMQLVPCTEADAIAWIKERS